MKDQSDYETRLPRKLVHRGRLALVLGGYMAICEWVPAGAARTAAANVILCLLPLLVNGALLLNAVTPEWRKKAFWMLLALGCSLWMVGQTIWTYVEVYQHRHISFLFYGDIVFFLHAVPMIAALTLRPTSAPTSKAVLRLCGLRADPLLVDVSLCVRRNSLAIPWPWTSGITSVGSASSPCWRMACSSAVPRC